MISTQQVAPVLLAGDAVGWSRFGIAHRVAQDIVDGAYVNLGMGIPLHVADYIPDEVEVYFHSENGILGLGPSPKPGMDDSDVIDAGKRPSTLVAGASVFDSSLSFAMIRGGHIDLAVLGAMEVTPGGDLANWTAPGRTPGVGGAMDLVQGARRTWAVLQHTDKAGASKLLERCTLPLTGAGVVERVITNLGVFEPAGVAFRVIELAPGVDRDLLERSTEAALDFAGLQVAQW